MLMGLKTVEWLYKLCMIAMACLLGTACNEEDAAKDSVAALQVAVQMQSVDGRALVTGDALPDGSSIGVGVEGTDGWIIYDGTEQKNVGFIAAGAGAGQTWSSADPVYLTGGANFTVYAYYPWQQAQDFDPTAIPVDVTVAQTDWLYATPAKNIDYSNPKADLTMNHALTAVRLVLGAPTYQGNGSGSSLAVSSEGLATSALLDTRDGSFSNLGGQGSAIGFGTFEIRQGKQVEKTLLAVPTGISAPLVFTAVVDGYTYRTTSENVRLEPGNIYTYTLQFNGKQLTIGTVSLMPFSASGDISLDFTVTGE